MEIPELPPFLKSLKNLDRHSRMQEAAEKYKRAEPNGENLSKFDFGTMPSCTACDKPILTKPLACAACMSALYCSKACSTANWKHGRGGALGHKRYCLSNKVHMQRTPTIRKVLTQFPWGRLEKDGSFDVDFARAYFRVLGGKDFGYWSEPGTLDAQFQASSARGSSEPRGLNVLSGILRESDKGYRHGYQLLFSRLDDAVGWRLEDEPDLIPKLEFPEGKEPIIAAKAGVVDWASWYKWRGLPMRSPAALLMQYPLTVYQLLVHVLQVAHPTWGSPECRKRITVHYLGVEIELNMIPIFAELALLLPHMDIDLVLFGPAVRDLVAFARERHPSSVAATASKTKPVYSYMSPFTSGDSLLRVFLSGQTEDWDNTQLSGADSDIPDAVIALNADLRNYTTWFKVFFDCVESAIPFAVTEYTEQAAEEQRIELPRKAAETMATFPEHLDEERRERMTHAVERHEYPVALNPFHRPGQRPIPSSKLPNLENGFTLLVVAPEKKVPSQQDETDARFTNDLEEVLTSTREMKLSGSDKSEVFL